MSYQPKTGARCRCKRGIQRDNCPKCEGTGWQIDFAAIRAKTQASAGQRMMQEQIDRMGPEEFVAFRQINGMGED